MLRATYIGTADQVDNLEAEAARLKAELAAIRGLGGATVGKASVPSKSGGSTPRAKVVSMSRVSSTGSLARSGSNASTNSGSDEDPMPKGAANPLAKRRENR
jgi:hypothetical protein